MNHTLTLPPLPAPPWILAILALLFTASLAAQSPEPLPYFVERRFLYEPECETIGGHLRVVADTSASSGEYVTAASAFFPEEPPGNDAADFVRLHFTPLPNPMKDYVPYFRIRGPGTGNPSLWLRTNGGTWTRYTFTTAYGSPDDHGWQWVPDDALLAMDRPLGLAGSPLRTLDIAFTGSGQQLDEVYLEDATLDERNYLPLPFDARLVGTNCPDFNNLPPVAILDPGEEVLSLGPYPEYSTSAARSYDPDGLIVEYRFWWDYFYEYDNPWVPELYFTFETNGVEELSVTVYDWYGASARDTSLWRLISGSFFESYRTHYLLGNACAQVGAYWTLSDPLSSRIGPTALGGTAASTAKAPPDVPENQLVFTVPYVPPLDDFAYEQGYSLQGSFNLPQEKGNCLWVSINDGDWRRWEVINGYSYFNDGGLNLRVGDNTIRLAYCSPKLQVNYLELSPDSPFADSYFGHGFTEFTCMEPRTYSYFLEAECTEAFSNYGYPDNQIHSSRKASGGYYVLANSGGTYNDTIYDNPDNFLRFEVNYIEPGTYQLQARINAPDNHSDSYYVRVNNGPWIPWRSGIRQGAGFRWNVFPEGGFYLSSGRNTIDFANRENGVMLDKIYLGPSTIPLRGLGDPVAECYVEEYTPASWWIEAECANYGNAWSVGADPAASQQGYLVTERRGIPPGPPRSGAGHIASFYLNTGDRYYDEPLYVYGRIDAPDADADSYWVRINGGEWIPWTDIVDGAGFQWNRLPVPLRVASRYDNVIDFTYREGGAKLDGIFVSTTDSLPDDPYAHAQACSLNSLTVEAECGSPGVGWTIVPSADTGKKAYVVYTGPRHLDEPGAAPEDNQLKYTMEVTEAGTYFLFLRMNAPDHGRNSFWVRVDGGEWMKMWKDSDGSQLSTVGFDWRRVNKDGIDTSFYLDPGVHSIRIAHRESGTELDQLRLSRSEERPLSILPTQDGCPSVPVERMAASAGAGGSGKAGVPYLSLYPNPVRDELTLDLDDDHTGTVSVVVYDATGRSLREMTFSKEAGRLRTHLSLADLRPGVYRLRVIEGDRQTVRSFLRM